MSKILLVEDEMSLFDLYKENLEQEGFFVIGATDGDSAVDLINNSEWDLLLLDIMLPKLDGMEVLKRIKQNPEKSSKPIIIITNLDNESLVNEIKVLGVTDFLLKANVTPKQLVDRVKIYTHSNDGKDAS